MQVGVRPMLALVVAGASVAWLGVGDGSASERAVRLHWAGVTAGDSAGAGWRAIARIAVPGKLVVMQSVAVAGAADAWAAGFAGRRGARLGRPVIEHWSGRVWRRVMVPGTAVTAFDRGPLGPSTIVGASSARNVWVFNQLTGAWLRWNGDRWRHGRLPAQAGSVATAVTAELVLARDEVWAFGGSVYRNGHSDPYAARFDGRRWLVTPMPRVPNLLVSAASAVSPGDIWAAGERRGAGPLERQPVAAGALAGQVRPLRRSDQHRGTERPRPVGGRRDRRQVLGSDRGGGALEWVSLASGSGSGGPDQGRLRPAERRAIPGRVAGPRRVLQQSQPRPPLVPAVETIGRHVERPVPAAPGRDRARLPRPSIG